MSILVDSDVVIEILRSRDQAILSKWTALANTGTLILYSPINAAEIWAGARPGEHPAIARFFSPLTCIPIEYEIGRLAGELLNQFSKSHNLKIADALMAASALQHKAALWTRNHKHYPMPNLILYT